MKLDIWLDGDMEILTATFNVIINSQNEYVLYRETYPDGGYHKVWFDGFTSIDDVATELQTLHDAAAVVGFYPVLNY